MAVAARTKSNSSLVKNWHILKENLPQFQEHGLSDEQIDSILVKNP